MLVSTELTGVSAARLSGKGGGETEGPAGESGGVGVCVRRGVVAATANTDHGLGVRRLTRRDR